MGSLPGWAGARNIVDAVVFRKVGFLINRPLRMEKEPPRRIRGVCRKPTVGRLPHPACSWSVVRRDLSTGRIRRRRHEEISDSEWGRRQSREGETRGGKCDWITRPLRARRRGGASGAAQRQPELGCKAAGRRRPGYSTGHDRPAYRSTPERRAHSRGSRHQGGAHRGEPTHAAWFSWRGRTSRIEQRRGRR
jgi:hypothetical protein